MDEQTFWDLVGTAGPNPAVDAFDRLADQLSDLGADDIRDFADHLARALHALDTPAHHRAAPGHFLQSRCAAVAAGAATYREVLHSPGRLGEFTGRRGEQMLTLAQHAYETSTRGRWSHRTPVSHETGSNVAAWSAHWLQPHMGTTTHDGHPPRAYMIALQHVIVTLDADPAWRAWWRRSGALECELGIVADGRLDHLRPSADIRQVRDKIRANFTCTPPEYDGRPADLFPLAVDEVTGMFEVIRQAIGLPELPPIPALPALPDEAWDVEVTTKPLPPEPREQQGYLTLAQIQEFFG
jgi:hypothetical protein